MISNPTNASVDTVNTGNNFPKVTTQTLGIADERVRDLSGFILNPQEIKIAVVKFLTSYDIDEKDIYSVKVGSKDNELRIYAEVRAKALRKKQKKSSWIQFNEFDEDNSLIDSVYCDMWRNKIFHGKNKHLQLKPITRNEEKHISIAFDPMIFIAFVYNINFCDPYYKVSAPMVRWKSNSQLDNLSGKERKKYKKYQTECSNYGISNCFVVVTFSVNNTYVVNNEQIVGFHPRQVSDFYSNN